MRTPKRFLPTGEMCLDSDDTLFSRVNGTGCEVPGVKWRTGLTLRSLLREINEYIEVTVKLQPWKDFPASGSVWTEPQQSSYKEQYSHIAREPEHKDGWT